MTAAAGDTSRPPRLDVRGLTKSFPGCRANDDISFTIDAGEIHALLGENGAGKSTLVKVLYGLLEPDDGEILWDGQPAAMANPAAARRLGIAMVFQHFSLFDSLTVAENIALGLDKHLLKGAQSLPDRIREISARYGLPIDPHRPVADLSVGERQRVEIVRALLQDPQLLVMDEPTSVLTPQEADTLFGTLRQLASEGRSILYISHKLEEVRSLCHRATILRQGQVVARCNPAEESVARLAELMIGTRLTEPNALHKSELGPPRLQVRSLSTKPTDPQATPLRNVSLTVHGGEIVGIAGVAGNGQGELMRALIGESLSLPEAVRIDDTPAGRLGPRARRNLGAAFVPEERLGRGVVPDLPLADNSLIGAPKTLGLIARGLIRPGRARRYAAEVIGRFAVAAPGKGDAEKAQVPATSLSGGNLQKYVIGREILKNPGLLVAAQPTWGVDAGAAIAIHQALVDLARAGAAVLVISQDLDELLQISDRIGALAGGRLSPIQPTAEVTEAEIGRLMAGLFDDPGIGNVA